MFPKAHAASRWLDGLYVRNYRIEIVSTAVEGEPERVFGRLVDDSTRKRPVIEFYIAAPERAFRNPEIINEVLAALASEIDSGKTVIHLGYDE